MFPLAAQLRSPGSKPAALRRSGLLPATVYGKTRTPLSLELDLEAFRSAFKAAGQTGLVELSVDQEKYAVLIHKYSVHPITRAFENVEFYNVLLTEKITTKIPLHLSGEAPASKLGLYLSQEMHEIEIEALPSDLVAEVLVDITGLKAVGDALSVRDLVVDKKVTLLAEPEEIVIRVQQPQTSAADDAEDAAEAGAQMPEVIGRKPTDEGDESA